jgi:hypothetical protein
MSDQGLSRLLLEAFRAVDAEVGSALEDRGAPELSPGHAAAMLLVDRRGTRLTELAARAAITKQVLERCGEIRLLAFSQPQDLFARHDFRRTSVEAVGVYLFHDGFPK